MSENFNFDQWFNSLSYNEDIDDKYETALIDLVGNKFDMSSFSTSHNLIVNNLDFIKKK